MRAFLLTAALCLGLGACSSAPSPGLQLSLGNGLKVGEMAGDGANHLVTAAAPHMSAATAATVKRDLDAGNNGVGAAYTAFRNHDYAGAAAQLAAAIASFVTVHDATTPPAPP